MSKLVWHLKTKHPALDKLFDYYERRIEKRKLGNSWFYQQPMTFILWWDCSKAGQVFLSHNKFKRRIDEMADDVESHWVERGDASLLDVLWKVGTFFFHSCQIYQSRWLARAFSEPLDLLIETMEEQIHKACQVNSAGWALLVVCWWSWRKGYEMF